MRNFAVALLLLAACGTDVRDDVGDDGYAPLVSTTWQVPASTEQYLCTRKTVSTDTWITAIRPISPLGTHHSVLMVGPADGPDGTTSCTSMLPKQSIYASAVGTQPFELPSGVAIHLKPGDQLLLNLHLYNADSEPLSGTSGVEIVEADPADIQHEAGVVMAGKASGLYVAPEGASTQSGTCTTPAGATIFAVAPHMHRLGTHLAVSYGTQVVFDQDYTFDGQRFQGITPITTVAGGKYTVTCSYFNPTGTPVYFGESTEDEMCYALTFVYPPPPVSTCTQ